MPTTHLSAREALRRIDERHEQYYETLLDDFRREVAHEVVRSVASLVDRLRSRLTFDAKGKVELTVPNRRILSKLDDEFDALMERYGYHQTIESLVNQFPGQLPFLKEEFDVINSILVHPLITGPLLTGPDLNKLLAQQQLTRSNLIDVAAMVGDMARREIMLSISALSIQDMTAMLSKTFSRTTEEARTLAATSATMFYRTAYSRVIDHIERDNPRQAPLRYTYDGPKDIYNRPWCRKMIAAARSGASWTRYEIERMDTGSKLPDAFISCGGFNCRHQWRIWLGVDEEAA